MFTNVSSYSTKLDKVSVQKKIVLSCFAAAILFFIKNPLYVQYILSALANLFF